MNSSASGPEPFWAARGHGGLEAQSGLHGDEHLVQGVRQFLSDRFPRFSALLRNSRSGAK